MEQHNKTKCIDDMRAYLGKPPYADHISKGSGMFYDWCIKKYGQDLVEFCLLQLEEEDEGI